MTNNVYALRCWLVAYPALAMSEQKSVPTNDTRDLCCPYCGRDWPEFARENGL